MPKTAVLVVTSHVARGAVGGRASVFALERMGFPVWSVPTVVLPWHPGHGRATRIVPEPAAFASLAGDLAGSPLLGQTGALFSGYLGSADQTEAVAGLAAALKSRSPAALVCCDPVAGDSAGLFQPAAVLDALRRRLVPLADIATPNRFELGWLTDMPAGDNAALVAAARALGPAEVVVTSAFAPAGETGVLVVTREGAHLVTHRLIAGAPHGTGDLFAALYLGHRLDGLAPTAAAERAASAVLAMVEMAVSAGADELPLAAGQAALGAAPAGVRVAALPPTSAV